MADENAVIHIEGKGYSPDDLTFREQREMRKLYRDLIEDSQADIAEAANMDFVPILVYLVRRRDEPEYTLEQALDLRITDLLAPVPPTKPARSKST